MEQPTRRIAVVAFPGVQVLDVTGPLEVFATAARFAGDRHPASRRPYAVEVLAREAGPLRSLVGQLHGAEIARQVQHYMEYDPAPPYAAEV